MRRRGVTGLPTQTTIQRGQVATDGSSIPAGNLRGQVATEFLLYTAVFMLLVVVSFIVVNHIQTTEIPLRQNLVAKETGSAFQNAITLAVKGGRGFSYNYTFQRTIFGLPYKIDMNPMIQKPYDTSIILDWEGAYGNFSYMYDVPVYNYKFIPAKPGDTDCLSEQTRQIKSDKCSSTLKFVNDGENLTIIQGES